MKCEASRWRVNDARGVTAFGGTIWEAMRSSAAYRHAGKPAIRRYDRHYRPRQSLTLLKKPRRRHAIKRAAYQQATVSREHYDRCPARSFRRADVVAIRTDAIYAGNASFVKASTRIIGEVTHLMRRTPAQYGG